MCFVCYICFANLIIYIDAAAVEVLPEDGIPDELMTIDEDGHREEEINTNDIPQADIVEQILSEIYSQYHSFPNSLHSRQDQQGQQQVQQLLLQQQDSGRQSPAADTDVGQSH